ncbi:MAG TPA: hypothetical protein VNT26_09215 [Candidatus Sulfotelmatobacter sp.]|nr:hypothetical protein [Candidatus Sulfotelmatobacter sp.]
MSLAGFCAELIASPRLKVPLPVPMEPEERAKAHDAIREMDHLARLEAPAGAPDLDLEVAVWAAEMLYRGCQFLVFREVDGPVVEAILKAPCPRSPWPSTYWSADLAFRYLPDLLDLAKGLSPQDPLATSLTELARQFPLSCAGTGDQDPNPAALDVLCSNPCLRRMLGDRVIARNRVGMLKHAKVREAVQEALGIYPDLAPAMADAIRNLDQQKEIVR